MKAYLIGVSWEGFTIILFGRHANHSTNYVVFEMLFLQIVKGFVKTQCIDRSN